VSEEALVEDIAQLVLEAHKTFDQEYSFSNPRADISTADHIIFRCMKRGNPKKDTTVVNTGAHVKMRGCLVPLASPGTAGEGLGVGLGF
jgi:hypothetical protein